MSSGDLLTNLAASLIAFVVGLLGRTAILRYQRHLYLTRVWQLFPHGRDLLYLSEGGIDPNFNPTDPWGEVIPALFEADVNAAVIIQIFMQSVLGRRDVRILSARKSTLDGALSGNILIIGGSLTNSLFERMQALVPNPFDFIEDPDTNLYTIHSKSSGAIYKHTASGGRTTYDVGIVFLTGNPFRPQCRLILIAGAGERGTEAAAGLLTSKRLLKTVPKSRPGRSTCYFIGAHIYNDSIGDPEVLETVLL